MLGFFLVDIARRFIVWIAEFGEDHAQFEAGILRFVNGST
jgi:hypothetical protein